MRFEGHYFDGQSALRHEVAVTLGTESLQIHGRQGGQLALWPYAGLRLLEEVYGGQSARIVRRGQSAAILVMAEPRFLAALEQRSGRRLGGARALSPGWKLAAGALLALLAVGAGLLWGLPRLIDPLAGLVPQAWERALGEKVVRQIAPPALACKAPAGSAALQKLVGRLLAGAPEPVSIRVTVARRPTVNAFAAPGGEIVVLQGFLDQAESAEEFAGVLAHEMAHSIERHPLKGLLRVVGLQLLFNALVGDTAALEGAAATFGQVLLTLSYSRESELAADRIGVGLLNRADIRGEGLTRFFQRLPAGGGIPPLLSSHPLHRERIALIRATATGRGAALEPAEWAALKAICPKQAAEKPENTPNRASPGPAGPWRPGLAAESPAQVWQCRHGGAPRGGPELAPGKRKSCEPPSVFGR